jgi:hypothetical protein
MRLTHSRDTPLLIRNSFSFSNAGVLMTGTSSRQDPAWLTQVGERPAELLPFDFCAAQLERKVNVPAGFQPDGRERHADLLRGITPRISLSQQPEQRHLLRFI